LLVTPVLLGKADEFALWKGAAATTFVSATPYFCPVHLSHGRRAGGKLRPISREIVRGLLEQELITSESEVEAIEELVFDYAPAELASVRDAVASGRVAEPVPPRQYFPWAQRQADSLPAGSRLNEVDPPTDFPPLPRLNPTANGGRFAGALIVDPDQRDAPFGVSSGLLVDGGVRFVRSLSFCRRRRGAQVKSRGRMLRINFREPRRPLALCDQCHFGLGLFAPAQLRESAIR
jgi:hypothetical protein